MYDQLVKTTEQPRSTEALLQEFGNKFSNANDIQSSLLNTIEDKLHNILNKRTPQTEGKQEAPNISDFISMADSQLRRLALQNNRLEAILSHLNQIV